jgi:hypothetical protein
MEEKKYEKLVQVKIIGPELDEKHSLLNIEGLVVNEDGYIYVYDSMLNKVYIIDKNGRFKKDLVRMGRGPGEISGKISPKYIYYRKGYFYIMDTGSRKIIVFDKKGKYLKDIRFYKKFINSVSVSDYNEHFYLLSDNCKIEVFNPFFKRLYLLNIEKPNKFIVWKPEVKNRFSGVMRFNTCDPDYLMYDVNKRGNLILYETTDSKIKIYKKKKVIRSFEILPKRALMLYKEKINRLIKKMRGKRDFYSAMFSKLIIDYDNPSVFYLDGAKDNNRFTLYKFNMNGKLLSVLYDSNSIQFFYKRNGFFYAYNIATSKIYVYRRGKNERK